MQELLRRRPFLPTAESLPINAGKMGLSGLTVSPLRQALLFIRNILHETGEAAWQQTIHDEAERAEKKHSSLNSRRPARNKY
jgi:hypothetical protein